MQICDDAQSPRIAQAGAAAPPPPKGPPARAPVVLILNGSDPLRAAIGLHLALSGYTVRTVDTVAGAEAAVRRGGIDAVVVEHLVRGPDAAGLLRQLSRARSAPVVLITESAAVRRLPQDALPAVAEVLVRNRFSLTELTRALAKVTAAAGRP